MLKDFFIRWLCGMREQYGHCDRMTISQMQRKTKIYERVHISFSMIFYLNGEFIVVPVKVSQILIHRAHQIALMFPVAFSKCKYIGLLPIFKTFAMFFSIYPNLNFISSTFSALLFFSFS